MVFAGWGAYKFTVMIVECDVCMLTTFYQIFYSCLQCLGIFHMLKEERFEALYEGKFTTTAKSMNFYMNLFCKGKCILHD